MTGSPSDTRARAMAVRGFLCQNVALGSAFGTFGVTVLPLQEKFVIGRGMASMGLALAVLTMGLAGPLVARMIAGIGLRRTMIGGIVLSALGYALLAVAPSIWLVFFAYAGPIGLGLATFGSLPASILASNWFRHNPGPALGFVNTPLLLAIVPLLAVVLVRDWGLAGLNFAMVGLHAVLLPFAWGIVDGPGADHERIPHAQAEPATRSFLHKPLFWLLVVCGGVLNAVGIVSVSHIVAFGIERGIPATRAAALLSVMGGANVLGSLATGLVCSRLGALRTLVCIGFLIGGGWAAMYTTHAFAPMVLLTLLIGIGGAGVFPTVNVAMSDAFGPSALVRTMSFFGLARLPITFCMPPLAGVLHDFERSYDAVAMTLALACFAVAIPFLLGPAARAARRF
jgi:cyanate permease